MACPIFGIMTNERDQFYGPIEAVLACVEFHFTNTTSAYSPIRIRYLFDTLDHAFRPDSATRAGFTYLISNMKKNRAIAKNLEKWVKQDYPEHFERCEQFLGRY